MPPANFFLLYFMAVAPTASRSRKTYVAKTDVHPSAADAGFAVPTAFVGSNQLALQEKTQPKMLVFANGSKPNKNIRSPTHTAHQSSFLKTRPIYALLNLACHPPPIGALLAAIPA